MVEIIGMGCLKLYGVIITISRMALASIQLLYMAPSSVVAFGVWSKGVEWLCFFALISAPF